MDEKAVIPEMIRSQTLEDPGIPLVHVRGVTPAWVAALPKVTLAARGAA